MPLKNDFNFFVPLDLFDKSKGAADVTKYPKGDDRRYENMVFEGLASDNSVDFEGESMEPSGFDISYFMKHGLFNLDHLTSRAKELKSRFWIGEPISAEIKGNKFFVKGRLWKNSPEARAFWDKCIEMKESGATRRPGMSIEGKALERDPKNPKRITKAQINNIALTMTPVNYNSYMDMVKGVQNEDFIATSEQDESVIFEKSIGNVTLVVDSEYRLHRIVK